MTLEELKANKPIVEQNIAKAMADTKKIEESNNKAYKKALFYISDFAEWLTRFRDCTPENASKFSYGRAHTDFHFMGKDYGISIDINHASAVHGNSGRIFVCFNYHAQALLFTVKDDFVEADINRTTIHSIDTPHEKALREIKDSPWVCELIEWCMSNKDVIEELAVEALCKYNEKALQYAAEIK